MQRQVKVGSFMMLVVSVLIARTDAASAKNVSLNVAKDTWVGTMAKIYDGPAPQCLSTIWKMKLTNQVNYSATELTGPVQPNIYSYVGGEVGDPNAYDCNGLLDNGNGAAIAYISESQLSHPQGTHTGKLIIIQ